MKREEIIDMARALANEATRGRSWTYDYAMSVAMRLVAAGAAAEREACAKVCEDQAWRCKKISVETQDRRANAAAIEASICAAAIRARGQA